MWYQSWQSGYDDILRRGFPRPESERTVLAELRSPHVSDFLHHGSGFVPFLVSAHTREVLEREHLTGFDYASVAIAKIATKGRRVRSSDKGEPEDSILKSRGVDLSNAPTLFAVYVNGFADVIPDYESGRTPAGSVSPFRLKGDVSSPDLWLPRYLGKPFSAWIFCSEKFRRVCEAGELSNIRFQSFEEFMTEFRATVDVPRKFRY